MQHWIPGGNSHLTFGKALVGVCLLFWTAGSTASATSYPNISSFYYGNTAIVSKEQTAQVSGSGLPYRYILPPNFNPNTKYPVIIFLHGLGECGTDNVAPLAAGGNTANGALNLVSTASPDNRDVYPCFFIVPQTTSGITWTGDQPTGAIQNLLNIFETEYPSSIDTSRIYLTGLSLGGSGTYDISILMRQPTHLGYNPFAALIPQSGNITAPTPAGYSASINAVPYVPIWIFHGANDGTVQIAFSDDINAPGLRNLGHSVIYTRYNTGGHGIWPTAYAHPLLLPWIFAQRLGQPQQGVPGLTINSLSQGSSLSLSGTSASATNYNYSRIGWTSNFYNGNYDGSGTGNGTTTFTATSASCGSSAIGQRFEFSSQNLFFTILGVLSAHVLTVDSNVPSQSGNFSTIPYGCYNNPFPATGSITPTWSLSGIPLFNGNNIVQVTGEAPANGDLGGLTTMNLSYLFNYTSHSGDNTPPTIAITSPTTSVTYSTSVTPLALGGTASDNVGVTQMTCTNNGVTSSTPILTSGNWSIPGGIVLVSGPNVITVTAIDVAGNLCNATITVNYTPGNYAIWKTTHFGANATNPVIAGDSADPDGDGVPNLLEYALSGDPNNASTPAKPVLSEVSGTLQLSFTRLAPTDVTYIVQGSNDLFTWTPLATFASGGSTWTGLATVNETGTGSIRNVTVTDTVPMNSAPMRYLRLRITNP